MSNKDELAEVIASELNKQFKSHQVAYFLDGVEDTPTDVTDFVSTGATILDLAVSNRPNGGLAFLLLSSIPFCSEKLCLIKMN